MEPTDINEVVSDIENSYTEVIDNLRMATKYTFLVKPIPDESSPRDGRAISNEIGVMTKACEYKSGAIF